MILDLYWINIQSFVRKPVGELKPLLTVTFVGVN